MINLSRVATQCNQVEVELFFFNLLIDFSSVFIHINFLLLTQVSPQAVDADLLIAAITCSIIRDTVSIELRPTVCSYFPYLQ